MSTPPEPQPTKESLEREKLLLEIAALKSKGKPEVKKLSLEVDALENGFRRTLATTLITALITVGLAVGGWMIEQAKVRKAAAEAAANHRDEVFAKVMNDFGSPTPSVRAAAVYALTQFSTPDDDKSGKRKQVIVALLYRLADEDNLSVIEQIVRALAGFGEEAREESIRANKRAALEFARASGRYVGITLSLGKAPNKDSALSGLQRFVSRVQFPGEFEHTSRMALGPGKLFEGNLAGPFGREVAIYWPKSDGPVLLTNPGVSQAELIPQAASQVGQKWRYLRATSMILVQLIRSRSGSLNQQDFSRVVLCCANFEKLDLRGINLRNADFFGMNAELVDLRCADLEYADLRASWLGHVKLSGADLKGTILPDFGTYDTSESPDFAGANWWAAKWEYETTGKVLDTAPSWLEAEFPQAQQEQRRDDVRKRCFEK